MAYECQNFKNGQILTAECLNKIDEWLEYICGKEVVSGEINENGELVLTLCNGEKMNIGAVSSIHIGADAPTDGSKVWIDTDEEPEEDNDPTVIENAPPNFAANEGEEGYIKNRTHYVDAKGVVHKLPNMYIDADWMATSESSGGGVEWSLDMNFTSGYYFLNPHWFPDVGIEWDVIWNGVTYPCSLVTANGEAFLGNRGLLGSSYPDTGEPFLFSGYALTNKDPELVSVKKATSTAETVSVVITTRAVTVYNKMPPEYLPDGVAMKTDIPEGGGSANIDVTAEVGQTIVVEEVDALGKPTKWKAADFQERTHWSEEIEIVPPTNFTPQYDSNISAPAAILNDFELIAGHKYKVIYDGAEYVCEAFSGALKGNAFTAAGNKILIGSEDTGEPFGVVKVTGASYGFVISLDMNSHSVQVFEEVARKIPKSFVPTLEEMRTKETVILPETTVECFEMDGAMMGGIPTFFEFESGKQYEVLYNGVKYVLEGVVTTDSGDGYTTEMSGVGNFAALGVVAGNANAPFVIGSQREINTDETVEQTFVLAFDGSSSVTLSIKTVEYTPIPIEYIPKQQYIYDIARDDLEQGTNGSADYYIAYKKEVPVALLEAMCLKLPILLRISSDGIEYVASASWRGMGIGYIFAAIDKDQETFPMDESTDAMSLAISAYVPFGNTGLTAVIIRFLSSDPI